MATIRVSTGGCVEARVISQPAVAVSATPEAADSAPRAMAATSARRDGAQSSVAGSAVVAGPAGARGDARVSRVSTRSASSTRAGRCATTITVRDCASSPITRTRTVSVAASRWAVGSSRSTTGRSPTSTRASASRARSPAESPAPSSPSSVSSPEGRVSTTCARSTRSRARHRRASVAAGVGVPEVVRDRAGGQPRPLGEPGHGGSPVVRGAVAGHPDRAVGGRQLAGDGGQQGRLATAGRADHGGQPDVEPGGQARHDRGYHPSRG